METGGEPKKRKGGPWSKYTPEQRKQIMAERREKGRQKNSAKAAAPSESHNGNGTLLEPAFELERFYEMMNALTVDYLNKNFTEQPMRDLCLGMRDTLDRCQKRLQQLENQRTAMLCDHCHKVLPGGRFAGEIVIRDEITNELRALRACGEPGWRVEVVTNYGETRRFIVGRSTGWRPCHIELHSRRSLGGMAAERHYRTVKKLYQAMLDYHARKARAL